MSVGGGSPGVAAREVARVVLDAVAEAHLLQHLEVVDRALLEALLLEELALVVEARRAARGARRGSPRSRAAHLLLRRDVVRAGIDRVARRACRFTLPRSGSTSLIASISSPKNSMRIARLLLVRREDLDDVAAHAEGAAVEVDVVALVLDVDEPAQERRRAGTLRRRSSSMSRPVVALGDADAVDARHARDDDDVARARAARASPSGASGRSRR